MELLVLLVEASLKIMLEEILETIKNHPQAVAAAALTLRRVAMVLFGV